MATYNELKDLSQNMDRLDTSVFMDFDIEGMPYHMPSRVSRASEAFYKLNKDVPGVMNTEWSDPEPRKGAFLNNYALTHLPELMPLIDKMNAHLDESKMEDPNYSNYVLGSAAEINVAVKNGMEADKIDYLCEIAVTKEWNWGDYRSRVVEARERFNEGETVDHARFIDEMKDENMQSVDFYREFCQENGLPVNDAALRAIGTAPNMGIAYGLQDAMKYHYLSADEAKGMVDCFNTYIAAARDENVNYKYDYLWAYKDDGTIKVEKGSRNRFDTFNMDYMVEDVMGMEDFRGHPKSLNKLMKDFINDRSTYTQVVKEDDKVVGEYQKPYTCLSHYYGDHKDTYAAILEEETKSMPKRDYWCNEVNNAYDDPYVVETISIIDNKPFAYEQADRIGHTFNIELSNELADKLGVYHDEEFTPMIQYATYLDGKMPEIRFSNGCKSVGKYDYSYDDDGNLVKTLESTHMERVMMDVNSVDGKFTKSQLDKICDITSSVMKDNFPAFELSDDVVTYENIIPERKSMDKAKAATAEFGDIQGVESESNGPRYQ